MRGFDLVDGGVLILDEDSTSNINDNYINYDLCDEGCKMCGAYNKYYSCPPYNKLRFGMLSKIYSKVFWMVRIIPFWNNLPYVLWWAKYSPLAFEFYTDNAVGWKIDKFIVLISHKVFPKKNLRMLTTRCKFCRSEGGCALKLGLPCRHPDKLGFPPESLGINLIKYSWERYGFPMMWFVNPKDSEFRYAPSYIYKIGGILYNDSFDRGLFDDMLIEYFGSEIISERKNSRLDLEYFMLRTRTSKRGKINSLEMNKNGKYAPYGVKKRIRRII